MVDRPMVIELDGEDTSSPADAPPINDADMDAVPAGQAMQTLASFATRRNSRLTAWFWRLLVAVIVFLVGVAAWDFATSMLARSPVVATAGIALLAIFLVVCCAIALRELAALARLRRIDRLQAEASEARSSDDTERTKAFARKLAAFYRGRSELNWGVDRLNETLDDCFDADTVLSTIEDRLLSHLDTAAQREVETAARQVATVTALVPLALADVIAALTANLRMIRRIAFIYGGRSGTLGSWRLTRAVISHLVATGAVAVGDDLLGSVGGGHILGKISRRFGEGLVNGALTARVGVAAMDVCRPMEFTPERRPRVSSIIGRALSGLFDKETAR